MTLLEQIKAAQLVARKAHDSEVASSLTTLIGEAETIGKNTGHVVTNQELIALLKKFIKNNTETFELVRKEELARIAAHPEQADMITPSLQRIPTLNRERMLYESFLPKQLSEEALIAIINTLVEDGAKNVGEVMKTLKLNYAGTYDGALASNLLKKFFK